MIAISQGVFVKTGSKQTNFLILCTHRLLQLLILFSVHIIIKYIMIYTISAINTDMFLIHIIL